MDSNAPIAPPYTQPYAPQRLAPSPPAKKKSHIVLIILGVILFLFLLLCGFMVAIYFAVGKAMLSSDVYKMSMADAHASSCVVGKIGEQFDSKGMPSGSVHDTNDTGDADMTIPVVGSHGKGVLHVIAVRSDGAWTINTLNFTPDGGAMFALLPTPDPCD